MAARRLLVILLVLLVISSIAAALAPQIERDAGTSTTSTSSTTTPADGEPTDGGELFTRAVDADAKDPSEVRLRPGDRLDLIVRSDEVGAVEIPSLGLLENVAPLSPARFDLLLDERAEHIVRLEGRRSPIARIVVEVPSPQRPKQRSGGGEG